jgi:hypothetical protein
MAGIQDHVGNAPSMGPVTSSFYFGVFEAALYHGEFFHFDVKSGFKEMSKKVSKSLTAGAPPFEGF